MLKGNSALFYADSIPIVLASDNNYLPYMAVTIQSIMENASPYRKYAFFILHKEIPNESIKIFATQVAAYKQFTIDFIDVADFMDWQNLFISRHITVETWFRLLIPDLLCNYEKAIYIDCDMVVCTDIGELFDIDLQDRLLAAAKDIDTVNWFYGSKTFKKVPGYHNSIPMLKNPADYFCAGLCLLNISLFRKIMPQERLLEIALSNEWDFHDQDVLNIASEGKVHFLSWHWGFYTTRNTGFFPTEIFDEYTRAGKNPKVIHFAGAKPWKQAFYIPYFDQFWKYATRTPFVDTIIQRMDIPNSISLQEIVLARIIKKRFGFGFIFECLIARLFRNRLAKKTENDGGAKK